MNLRELWNFSDPVASRERFVALRDEVTTQIARTHSLKGEFTEAHAILDTLDVDTLAPRPKVCCLLERGRTYNSAKELDEARSRFLEAWETALEHHLDALAIDAAHMLGIVETGDLSVEWNERAMELAETSDDPAAARWLGALYNNLGWTYHDAEDYERALDLFQRGVAWRAEREDVEPLRIAKWTVGRALRSLGRFDEAREVQHALEAEREATGEPGGFVFEELGELYLADDPERSAAYFAKALPLLTALGWVEQDRLDRIARLSE